MSEGPWLPDGVGLADEARAVIAEQENRIPIHLRLSTPGHRNVKSACDRGLGEWWTGKAAEVTCKACLQLVHA